MRRAGLSTSVNSVGNVTTTTVATAALCDGHGGVADYDGTTNIVTCTDGVYCNGSNDVCVDASAPAAAACALLPAMTWDNVLLTCVVDNSNLFSVGQAKAACNATAGFHWDDALGCIANTPTNTGCAIEGCSGTLDALSGACVKTDPSCASGGKRPVRGKGQLPGYAPPSPFLSPAAIAAAVAAKNALAKAKIDCAAAKGTWNASKNVCIPSSSEEKLPAKSSNALLYVGGAGVAALLLWLATRKKGSKK